MALVPLPILAHVDDVVVALVHQLADVVELRADAAALRHLGMDLRGHGPDQRRDALQRPVVVLHLAMAGDDRAGTQALHRFQALAQLQGISVEEVGHGQDQRVVALEGITLERLRREVAEPRGVPLSQIASIDYGQEYPIVWRRDRIPTLTVQADVVPGLLPATAVKAGALRRERRPCRRSWTKLSIPRRGANAVPARPLCTQRRGDRPWDRPSRIRTRFAFAIPGLLRRRRVVLLHLLRPRGASERRRLRQRGVAATALARTRSRTAARRRA